MQGEDWVWETSSQGKRIMGCIAEKGDRKEWFMDMRIDAGQMGVGEQCRESNLL